MKRNNNFPEIKSSNSETFLIEIFGSDGYIQINKKSIQIFGLIPAIILSNYIDKYKYFKDKNPENNGWFFLTHNDVKNQLGIGEHSITNAKSLLKNLGIIKTKMIGIPPKEWMGIDFDKIEEIFINGRENIPPEIETINTSKSRQLTPQNRDNIKNNIYKNNKIKDNKNNLSLVESVYSKNNYLEYFPIAGRLSEIIRTKKNFKHTPVQINSWCREFSILVKKHDVSIERISNALEWYAENISDQYTPVIESGRSFREKFVNLEQAIERSKHTSNNNSNTLSKYRKPANGYMSSDHKADYFAPLPTTKISNTKN